MDIYGVYVLLRQFLSLRSKLQPLAKKYSNRPREYHQALCRLIHQTEGKFVVPLTTPHPWEELRRSSQRLSKRQQEGFGVLMQDILPPLVSERGGPKAPSDDDGRKLVQAFQLLGSKPSRAEPRPRTKEIRRLYYECGIRGYGRIASMFFSFYDKASPDERRDMKEQVREAVR